jgi:hypothetical protein
MRNLLIMVVLVLVAGTTFGQTLQKMEFTNVHSLTKSFSAGQSDTSSSQIIAVEADSLGFVIEGMADSLSGEVRIQYLSPSQYPDNTAFASLPVVVTLPINSKAAFGLKIVPLVTQGWARLWLISKNNKITSQTGSFKIYRVRRR